MFGDNEQHRICCACVAKDGKRKAPAADTCGRGQSERPKVTNGGSKKSQPSRKEPRAQPDLDAMLEMLKLMDAKVTHEQIADRFACSVRLVRDVKKNGRTRFQIAEPDLKALTETVNKLSTSVHEAQQQGSRIEAEDIAELLAELRIEPGKRIEEEAVNAIQGWATFEDDDEVVEAIRLDTVDDTTAQLNGVHMSAGREEEDEQEEDRGDEDTGRVRRAPPAYGELSSYFGVLEAAAEKSGNGEAALYLAKAKMAMIVAHSATRVRQADMRELSRRSEDAALYERELFKQFVPVTAYSGA
ncbi:unnamed protein product [Ectocarpus sp. CCAP 1310/34]|nr:unnamed protein product [Ectocarpus sp. CCAP 1310/34]